MLTPINSLVEQLGLLSFEAPFSKPSHRKTWLVCLRTFNPSFKGVIRKVCVSPALVCRSNMGVTVVFLDAVSLIEWNSPISALAYLPASLRKVVDLPKTGKT